MNNLAFSGTSRTLVEPSRPSTSMIRKKIDKYDVQLEELIDPDQDYERFKQHGLTILKPKTLYQVGLFESKTEFFKQEREQAISCLNNQCVSLPLISNEAHKELRNSKYNFMHLGLIIIGIKGLTRKNIGGKVLVSIYDDRWSNIAKAMIASIEVDMNNNSGIFYCSPDFMITINDTKNIKIGIQTKGYEDITLGENLLLHTAFLGRCTINSKAKYKVNITNVVNLLSSKGIKMIKTLAYDPERLAGLEWEISKFIEEKKVITPQEALLYEDRKGKT